MELIRSVSALRLVMETCCAVTLDHEPLSLRMRSQLLCGTKGALVKALGPLRERSPTRFGIAVSMRMPHFLQQHVQQPRALLPVLEHGFQQESRPAMRTEPEPVP